MNTILVTGAAGFAGSHVVEALAGNGTTPLGWTHRAAPPSEIVSLAEWESVDLLDLEAVRAAIARARPSAVVHCAGAPNVAHSWRDTLTPLSVNVLATHHLFDALRRAGAPCRVIVPGSATVYAASAAPLTEDSPVAPSNPYAVSKLAQEELSLRAAREDGVDVIVTRPFNHTGPRQSAAFAAPNMARQIALIEAGLAEPLIRVGNLEAQRDFTDVRDIARAYVGLIHQGTPSTVYNVSSGVPRVMRSVLEALVTRARVAVRVEPDPALMRPSDTPVLVGDSTKLQRTTGWQPQIAFDRTLDDLLNYWRRVTHA
ncbi:MAG TPA: GDP-mannose 4,6-dehydratase [Vicinamibacterales bacterium]|nr:GDP-mannose 4,6-dehydratase [Vicinamibacterales bacterium]